MYMYRHPTKPRAMGPKLLKQQCAMTDWAFILFLFYGHYINCVLFFYTVDWYLAARIKFCVCKEDHRHRVDTKVYFL